MAALSHRERSCKRGNCKLSCTQALYGADCPFGFQRYIFVQPKHFSFQKPEIQWEKLDNRTWKFTTDKFAKFVEVDFGPDRILSDNYFDLIPGREKIITLEEEVEESPVVYSLYDSYH